MTRPRRRFGRKSIGLAVALVAAVVVAIPLRAHLLREYGRDHFYVLGVLLLERIGIDVADQPGLPGALDPARTDEIVLDPSIVPFTDVGESLGPLGKNNNLYIGSGVAVLDANGDGRLDLYILHDGRPRTMQTDENGLLSDRLSPAKPSALYLNMGNDAAGRPILRSVQELAAEGDQSLLEAELLIENKYQPRRSLSDDPYAPGRIGRGAVPADFDGDGRVDLLVANGHDGLPYQTDRFGLKVYSSRDNLGRGARDDDYVVLRTLSFLRRPLEDGLHRTVELDGRSEPEGGVRLFLNSGDEDGDGIPEWRDATDEAGLGGHRDSQSITVADIDRDGDLDAYVSNFLDSDFWGFSDDTFAGNRNELYVNQLVESGRLVFQEAALEWGVAGLHDEEGLVSSVRFPGGEEREIGEAYVDGRQVGEKADHSWASLFVDWSDDGWPDLVVANDEGNRLRIYENADGERFDRLADFDSANWDGCWMAVSVGDFANDMKDRLFVSNCGGQSMTAANTSLMVEDDVERPSIHAMATLSFRDGSNSLRHAVLGHQPDRGFVDLTPEVRVTHSPYIPPDLTRRENFAPSAQEVYDRQEYASGLAAYEFAWGAAVLDVDNDGALDIYIAGGLARGNDGFLGDTLGSPGRLLVNDNRPGELRFTDRTLEYRLLDVAHMDYDHNPPRRPAPGTGWHKRDFIYLEDVSAFMESGLDAAEASRTLDIFKMHEAATGITSGDLNGDGYEDIVVTHMGGYDSNSPEARNLKVDVAGRALAIPAPNPIYRAPTNFEEGGTSIYINGGPRRGTDPNWVKIRLIDEQGKNSSGVGARLVANGRHLRRYVLGGTTWSAAAKDLVIGLGDEPLRTLEVTWPWGEMTPQRVSLEPPVTGRLVCVDRQDGVVACPPSAAKAGARPARGAGEP